MRAPRYESGLSGDLEKPVAPEEMFNERLKLQDEERQLRYRAAVVEARIGASASEMDTTGLAGELRSIQTRADEVARRLREVDQTLFTA